ncbi:hypothetical protein BLTE_26740 [Blastochloris tepida]|uniref:YhaN AAA domain-containing protein n=1 Tax=Blastochloris tepida TaxID=2233851 RepID=A0A348G356_9HYPH|nr:YhaN family protein [Blastochloris tepida]BBF93989.1 hypothetical protein BLTE_26740 [Blastochloris tepida]
MRFSALGLDRYGCFTGRRLDFDPRARLTVIVGANEAGKSTALAAVADALFGIEERSRFSFLHDYKSMRLSAEVAGGDGRTLAFARLKRRAATLVDPASDAPLADDCLAPFLGAHDRRAFLEIYGLDQARLREGGRKLLAGGGDLADTLLAAAPGLGRIAALRDRLRDGAAQIFNPDRRNANAAFYRALDRRTKAQRLIRDTELRVEDARALREGADSAAKARAAAVAAEIEAALALSRAQTLVLAARELRTIDGELAARTALGPLPEVPAGFVARARKALADLAPAQEAMARAGSEEAAAREALAAIAVDDAILALAEAVEALEDERAAVEKELKSLPNRRTEATEARAKLERIAKGLDLPDVDALRARMPGPPLFARAERLAGRLAAAATRTETLEGERAKLAQQRRKAEEARAGLGHVADPTPVRRRLDALDGAEERERALVTLDRKLAAGQAALTERTVRLGLAIAGPDALATLALPAPAAAEAALRGVRASQEALSRQNEILSQLSEQLALTEARHAALTAGRPAPTESVIAAARRSRDDLWAALRPVAMGERAASDTDRDAALRLEPAIAAADRLADERQTETQRLAELAQIELKIAETKAQIEATRQRAAEATAQAEASAAAWQALWAASGVTLPADETALAVLREAAAILTARDALGQEAAACEVQREAVRFERAEIDRLRLDLGLPALGAAPTRMADLREVVADLERRFGQARAQDHAFALLDRQAADIAERTDALSAEIAALSAEAADLFPHLAIRPGASHAEARAALDLWRETPALDEALGTAEHRIAGIERDEAAFAARVEELLQRAGETPAGEDMFAAARRLRARLDQARQARTKADAATDMLAKRQEAMAAATAGLARAQAAMAAIFAATNIDDAEVLGPLLDRLDQAAAIDARLAEARARLAGQCDGRSEDDVRAAIAGQDAEMLARAVAEAKAAHDLARAARDRAIEADTEARTAKEAMEQREGAAAAAQEAQDAVAEIAQAVERFTRDHVAARLLSAAMDRYRAQHQSPIVERASRLFGMLTCGRWNGIGIDYDQDPPHLATLRDGRLHAVDALSEGTADQLFLALRIAAIEEHARRAAPLPFIADDILVSFDEARTESGLQALAELGALTQVIVFTHHEHVATSAERVLADAASIIRL